MSIMKIVAGGGGNPTTTSLPLFEAGLNMTGLQKPNILLIPTAKNKPEAYANAVSNMTNFGQQRGLPVQTLHGFGVMPNQATTAELLGWADIIYVSGGNTRHMMGQWESIQNMIYNAVKRGSVVATGISAGMLAWFDSGHSDSLAYEVPEGTPWDYIRVDGLGIIRAVGCPHLDSHHPQTKQPRRESFEQMLAKQPMRTVGIGLDESAGMQIVDGTVTVLSAGLPGSLHRFLREGTQLDHCEFTPSSEAFPLEMFTH